MLRKLTYLGLAGCLLLLVTSAAIPSPQEEKAAENKKVPKDQQEYELISKAFSKETSAQERLKYLDEWQQEYPETAFDVDRARLFMVSYHQTNQDAKALEAAQAFLEKAPGDFTAHYLITSLTPFVSDTTEEQWADAEEAANALLNGGIEKQFAAANKPAGMDQAQWDIDKEQAIANAYQTLGWIAMQRKEHVKAEEAFKKSLEANPNSAQVSYWLGQEVSAQANPDKNELALFSFARAASYEGPGALTPQGRQQLDEYLVKVYSKYTGTDEGLEELKAVAKTQPLPPSDLNIESAEVRRFNDEQARRKADPLLYKFIDLKTTLLGAQGEATWGKLRGALTPEMSLYVVSSDSARPTTINLSSQQGGPVEVVLGLENRLRAAPRVGSKIRFEGVASSLNRDPFRLGLIDGRVL